MSGFLRHGVEVYIRFQFHTDSCRHYRKSSNVVSCFFSHLLVNSPTNQLLVWQSLDWSTQGTSQLEGSGILQITAFVHYIWKLPEPHEYEQRKNSIIY